MGLIEDLMKMNRGHGHGHHDDHHYKGHDGHHSDKHQKYCKYENLGERSDEIQQNRPIDSHHDNHHDEHRPVYNEHRPYLRGSHKTDMAFLMLEKLMSNKTLLIGLIIGGIVLLLLGFGAILLVLPIIGSLFGLAGKTDLKGMLDPVIKLLQDILGGAQKAASFLDGMDIYANNLSFCINYLC
jgi:hypothetical protein